MNPWLRRILIGGGVLFGLVALMAMCGQLIGGGGSSDSDNPTGTVKAAVMAYESRKILNVTGYFTPQAGGNMNRLLTRIFSMTDKITVQNFQGLKIYEEGLAAHVEASWDLVMWVKGSVSVEHYAKLVKLVNYDGKWYINESF